MYIAVPTVDHPGAGDPAGPAPPVRARLAQRPCGGGREGGQGSHVLRAAQGVPAAAQAVVQASALVLRVHLRPGAPADSSALHRCADRQTAMETVRKTYKEKRKPPPTQERTLEAVLWRCRTLYNVALEQRLTWWRRWRGVSVTRFPQEAELKAIRKEFPE